MIISEEPSWDEETEEEIVNTEVSLEKSDIKDSDITFQRLHKVIEDLGDKILFPTLWGNASKSILVKASSVEDLDEGINLVLKTIVDEFETQTGYEQVDGIIGIFRNCKIGDKLIYVYQDWSTRRENGEENGMNIKLGTITLDGQNHKDKNMKKADLYFVYRKIEDPVIREIAEEQKSKDFMEKVRRAFG